MDSLPSGAGGAGGWGTSGSFLDRRERCKSGPEWSRPLVYAHIDHPAAQHGDQVLDRIHGDDLTLIDDGHPVAQQLHFFHVVAGVDHAHAALAVESLHALEDVVAALRVHAHGGLVQEEQAWLVHQPGGDVHPALHPTREFVHRLVGAVGQGHHSQHIVDAFLELATAQPVDTPEEVQVGPRAEGGIERQVLRHQTVDLLDLVWFLANIIATDARCAGGGWDDPR